MRILNTRWVYAIVQLNILMLSVALCGGFFMQFALNEIPCPLCYLQRVAMMVCASALSAIVLAGKAQASLKNLIPQSFGLVILAALAGACVSVRQILLHIAPGDSGFGTAVLGLHLYTWGLIVFFLQTLSAATILICHDDTSAEFYPEFGAVQAWLFWLTVFVILGNLVAVFAAAGWNWGLPSDPVEYLLFK